MTVNKDTRTVELTIEEIEAIRLLCIKISVSVDVYKLEQENFVELKHKADEIESEFLKHLKALNRTTFR